MPISFVATGPMATGTNPVVTPPSGIQQQDLLFLFVTSGVGIAPSTPSGWTSVGFVFSTPTLYIFRKFAGAAESNLSVTISSTSARAVMVAYRGVSSTDTISTFTSATSTTITPGSLTATYANEFIVNVYAMTTGAATWTAPVSTTTRVDGPGTSTLSGLLVVDELKSTSGAVTARTATSSVSKAITAVALCIIPSGRYWVGGTSSWDGTGTKWAFSSNGANNAPTPGVADDVFFDSASGTSFVSVGLNQTVKSIDCTGFIGTLSGSSSLTLNGSLTLSAGMTMTYSGVLTISGIGNITSAGKTIPNLTINGSGITVTMADALVSSGAVTVTLGTFNTGNFNLTATQLSSNNTNVRTINLGSSTVTLSNASPIVFTTNTNLTFNAGTSNINCTSASVTLSGGAGTSGSTGVVFYNVALTSTTISTHNIQSINTFNNFTVTGPPSATGVANPLNCGHNIVNFNSRQTINGAFGTTGTQGNARIWFRSSSNGLAQTLTINSAATLSDADFRDIIVTGTAAPISGTRIGNLGGCQRITFSTPKTVYAVGPGGTGQGAWDQNVWSNTSGGTPSTDFFPLAQDTAIIDNSSPSIGCGREYPNGIPYIGTIDLSARTIAYTFTFGTQPGSSVTIYGSIIMSSVVTTGGAGGSNTLNLSGRNTQTIISAGRSFSSTNSLTLNVNSINGIVQLGDALNLGNSTLAVSNGTFNTNNFNITAPQFTSTSDTIREINLGSSTITLSGNAPLNFNTLLPRQILTLNAGTSTINLTGGFPTFVAAGLTWYNVNFTGITNTGNPGIISPGNLSTTFSNFNTLSITAPGVTSNSLFQFQGPCKINTWVVTGGAPNRRILFYSVTEGTPVTIDVGTLNVTDCDFRDIAVIGSASGSTTTRIGNLAGNSGLIFPSKTVYWNLAGAQNWADGWCLTSGGTPNANNFPLAQDTAIFDDFPNSVTGTITVEWGWFTGTLDTSARTTAMTIDLPNRSLNLNGNLIVGTGVIVNSSIGYSLIFIKRNGTQTITSNGQTLQISLTISSIGGTVLLADALTLSSAAKTLSVLNGTFDAATYNVSIGLLSANNSNVRKINMGSGTWTLLADSGTVWTVSATNLTFIKGTANIVLSSTGSGGTRVFVGGGQVYNKLTIGGATGVNTTSISDNNYFSELASIKTVAHTIDLGTSTQTFGKWTVTGTAGNVVTLSGTGVSHIIAGACTSNIDYLAMGSIGFASTSPGEFYAGANSTGTAGAPVYRTAKPANSTRYWVGGSGNWSDTLRWSTASNGAGGASVPRSHDDVIFDSGSSATAYTATVDAVTGGLRCKSLTIAGPASGSLSLGGSTNIDGVHDNITLAATGLVNNYLGIITLSGSTLGRTLTTNGVGLGGSIIVNGAGCEWVSGSSLSVNGQLSIVVGTFDLSTYNYTASGILGTSGRDGVLKLGSGTHTLSGSTPIDFGTTEQIRPAVTVIPGTSTINCSRTLNCTINGNNKIFNNVIIGANTAAQTSQINGNNTFNNLTLTATSTTGIKWLSLGNNQIVNGTLTIPSLGNYSDVRTGCISSSLEVQRTITAASVSLSDVDFRDIAISGVAAPASGIRIGNLGRNTGIIFTTPKTVYWSRPAGGLWGNTNTTGWASISGGTPAFENFPLPQDTAIIEDTGLNSGSTITLSGGHNISTINMSSRTLPMTLSISASHNVCGNLVNGSGTTLSGSGTLTFIGPENQTITSAGKTFSQPFTIDSPNRSVTLQDALVYSSTTNLLLTRGTFNSAGYNVTISSTGSTSGFTSSTAATRTLALGSGSTWTLAPSSNVWYLQNVAGLTITGSATLSFTSASSKTITTASIDMSQITINQGGAGTLNFSGNSTFKTLSNSYSSTGATTIGINGVILTLTELSKPLSNLSNTLSISGSGTIIYTGTGIATDINSLNINSVTFFPFNNAWYMGNNSINNGSLGAIFDSTALPQNPKFFNI